MVPPSESHSPITEFYPWKKASLSYICSLIHMKVHFPVYESLMGNIPGTPGLEFLHPLPCVWDHTRSKMETGCSWACPQRIPVDPSPVKCQEARGYQQALGTTSWISTSRGVFLWKHPVLWERGVPLSRTLAFSRTPNFLFGGKLTLAQPWAQHTDWPWPHQSEWLIPSWTVLPRSPALGAWVLDVEMQNAMLPL